MHLFLLLSTALAAPVNHLENDPHAWLEDVYSDTSLDWVRGHNETTVADLAQSEAFTSLQSKLRSILESDERIPYVAYREGHLYNVWRDAQNPRGLWRRTTMESYRTETPEWELILDLDALGTAEEENWVWHGSTCLPETTRCLVRLSRGGADADVVREFDTASKAFIDGGFVLPEAKTRVSWIDQDHLFVGTNFGDGSLTESGYPRIVKRWTRGTSLDTAETIFEADVTDISAYGWHDSTPGFERDFVGRGMTFYTNELYEVRKDTLLKIDKPDSANASVHREWLLFELRDDWTLKGVTYPSGSLIATQYKRWMKGKREVTTLFTPTPTSSLAGFSFTRNHLVLNVLEHVKNKLMVRTPPAKGKGPWTEQPIQGLPEFGTVSAWPLDAKNSDDMWFSATDYLSPSSLWYGSVKDTPQPLKETPAWFNAENLSVSQHFATSKDGTKVPYFQVSRKDIPLDGSSRTLLYGYGGFEISLLPSYNPRVGTAWLEKGGVFVVANIRGGGEYGPRWHQAALKEHRHRAYEDFSAIGQDLVARGVTRPEQLGIQGGSNGGLLMGNMYTLYPKLWGAVVCQVPLLDMKRYTHLLAGASWAGEYGDPDTDDWSYIQTFSPYHNIETDTEYPPILFTTSTRDDRVHPAHARKMAAALMEASKDVHYYENIEGGHGGAANNEQAAFMSALAYTFLWETLAPKVETTE